ncbi:MAG: SRPBCC family protein [Proteobacteria bacterium]|nr:SRPBCC family protein [Pseudomonadota bacterium]MDA1059330.1 SRPBCC family protein [Pseudomonadota bacterium]
MSETDDTEDHVTLAVTIPGTPDAAYRIFVDGFGTWWPTEYTFCGENLAAIAIEGVDGGRCFERAINGRELVWGTVTLAEPGQALIFRWHITADRQIEADPDRASEVAVAFQAAGDGDTTVMLVHSGLSRHGGDWAGYRAAMASEQGWPYCLDHFRAAAGS